MDCWQIEITHTDLKMATYKLCLFVLFSTIALNLAKPADDSDPPPLDCPQHEEYMKCALERCFKTCDHLAHFPACPMIAPGCIDQACVCKPGYLRNAQGICVLKEQCPEWRQFLEENSQSWLGNFP